jgi:hypothetical protein
MSKFADELYADLMRDHGQVLEHLDRQAAPGRQISPPPARALDAGADGARPPRRRPGWLAPATAAAGVLLAVGLAAALGGLVRAGRPAGPAGAGGRAETAYVFNGNDGTLTPISPVTGRLGRPVKVGPGARWVTIGGFHHRVPAISQNVILQDGRTDYVVYNTRERATILRAVSLVTGAAGKQIRLGPDAGQVVVTPGGRTAYVGYSNPASRNGPTVLRPVSLATGAVGKPILTVRGYAEMAITPDGKTIYAVSMAGTVTPVSTVTNRPGKPIPVPGAFQIAFTPDGRTAFVTSVTSGGRPRSFLVTPISTATGTRGRTIRAGEPGTSQVFAPDGKTIYDVHTGTSVVPIPVRTGRAGKPIPLKGAGNMAITPDGKTGYAVNVIYSSVTPISLTTGTAAKPLDVPGYPLYIVITPDGRNAYAYSNEAGDKQTVIPITTATSTPGKPITITSQGITVLTPGEPDQP